MRLAPGNAAPPISLPAIDGTTFSTDRLHSRKYLLSFFRYAGCPFCNLRLRELATRHAELPDRFNVVAVFDSPMHDLLRYAPRHNPPFPVLADASNTYYKAYGVEHSMAAAMKGAIAHLPTALKAVFKHGYIPWTIKGRVSTLPADFLIDEEGVVRVAHYAKDEVDRLAFDEIKRFAGSATTATHV